MMTAQQAREKCDARRLLGVEKYSTQSEIRIAWRRLAIETHPDQPNGSVEGFRNVNEAYELLKGDALETRWTPDFSPKYAEQAKPRPVKRPRIVTKTVDLSPVLSELCQSSLNDRPSTTTRKDTTGLSLEAPVQETFDHVPNAIRSKGRRVSYIVNSVLKQGTNRVALPISHLTGNKYAKPEVVQLNADSDGRATIQVSDEMLATKFAGAERVRIHFGER